MQQTYKSTKHTPKAQTKKTQIKTDLKKKKKKKKKKNTTYHPKQTSHSVCKLK